jgi:hypothetical protein
MVRNKPWRHGVRESKPDRVYWRRENLNAIFHIRGLCLPLLLNSQTWNWSRSVESDTMTLRWERRLLKTTTQHNQSCDRTSLIAHSRMWSFWKVSLFTFPIFSVIRTRKGGLVIPQYPNLSLACFSILLYITIRFTVYLKQRLSSVPFSAHISLFWEFFC